MLELCYEKILLCSMRQFLKGLKTRYDLIVCAIMFMVFNCKVLNIHLHFYGGTDMTLVTGQFNDSYKPVMDGVVNVVRNYAYWLNLKYGKSYIITPAFPQYADNEEFSVKVLQHRIAQRSPYRLGIPQLDFFIRKRINLIPFDIVHAHCPFSSTDGP